jgi:hypothetical protein
MPRSNRPSRRNSGRDEEPDGFDLSRALMGRRGTEHKRDGAWTVQPLAATSALKQYTCPSCARAIAPGTAHIVAWRADGIMGEAEDLAARRHWHTHCWRIKP